MSTAQTTLRVRPEPLLGAFGFKGGALSELWQVTSRVTDAQGRVGVGMGVQSALWSDARLFAAHGERACNEMMLDITRMALERVDASLTPSDALNRLFPEAHEYAVRRTGAPALEQTFTLGALVSVDLAMWQLMQQRAREDGRADDFLSLCAPIARGMTCRHSQLGAVPLITYGVKEADILSLARDHFVLKIKLGHPGGMDDMLDSDISRLARIHALVRDIETPYTECGHVMYYLDANGRYDSMERLKALLSAIEKMGALPRVLMLEEPFALNDRTPVNGLPVRVAADESAHTARDAAARIDEMGYGAIALKPIAKTLSGTLAVLDAAQARGVPCFCADLTVNPWMVDWNKCLAARLAPLPGLKIGILESNGAQNYVNWPRMLASHPMAGADWIEPRGGLYSLSDDFYACSGGVFLAPREPDGNVKE